MVLTDAQRALQEAARRYARERLLPDYQKREKLGVTIEGPHRDDQWLLVGLAERGVDDGRFNNRNVVPDRYLGDGDTVEVAGFVFEIIHAPGHSPGSVVFFNRDQ